MAQKIDSDNVPRWVERAKDRYIRKFGRPINQELTFVGRTFLYKVWFEPTENQRLDEHWTIKKRYNKQDKTTLFALFWLIVGIVFTLFLLPKIP